MPKAALCYHCAVTLHIQGVHVWVQLTCHSQSLELLLCRILVHPNHTLSLCTVAQVLRACGSCGTRGEHLPNLVSSGRKQTLCSLERWYGSQSCESGRRACPAGSCWHGNRTQRALHRSRSTCQIRSAPPPTKSTAAQSNMDITKAEQASSIAQQNAGTRIERAGSGCQLCSSLRVIFFN
jgi:hypothetical protein